MAREILPSHFEQQVPSNAFTYLFREAFRRIWISKRTSFVAIAMIAISLVIVGGFLLVSENLKRGIVQAEGRSRVTIYLLPDAGPDQIKAVDAYLAAHADVARRRFVSRDEALRRFKTYFSNLNHLVGELGENPFPPSFEVDIEPGAEQTAVFRREVGELRAIAGVEDVQFDYEWVRRLKQLVNLINLAGITAGAILAIAAAFTIANVIRLTMVPYRKEIEIMRLVGATERIIRGPFLLEGVLQGTIGGLVAIGLLFAGFMAARQTLAPASSLMWGFLFARFLPWQKLLALIAGGMVAGYIGSWISVHEAPEETA
jgi:cell division transport system permease protein